jgi:hypothetical protein
MDAEADGYGSQLSIEKDFGRTLLKDRSRLTGRAMAAPSPQLPTLAGSFFTPPSLK